MIEYPPAGVERPGVQSGPARPGKSFVVTWLLALLVGMLGADRFYLGKVGTGLLKLVTCGGAGVWALVDLVLVLTGSQRDKQGRPLAGYPERRTMAWGVTAAFLALGLVVGACGAAVSEGDPPGSAVVDEADDPDEEVAPEGEPEPEPEPVEDEPEPADEPAAEEEPPEAEPAEEDIDAAAWADERFGTFEPVRETGRGDSLVSLLEGDRGPGVRQPRGRRRQLRAVGAGRGEPADRRPAGQHHRPVLGHHHLRAARPGR